MIGELRSIVLDARDIAGLAAFYTNLAGWKEAYADEDWISLVSDDGWRIAFQLAPDHVPPQWPGQELPQQAHLDLRVQDLEAATARAVELGATATGAGGPTWNTLLDPAGHPFDLCRNEEDPHTTVYGVTLDCPDAAALSRFYSELLGKPVTYEQDGMAMIGEDHPVLFQQVAEYSAPRWPDPDHPQQLHFDVEVADIDVAEPAALALGATHLANGDGNFRVYADPAGKPFCLTWGHD